MTQQSLPVRIWNAPQTLWVLLSLPALPLLISLFAGEYRAVLHPSGEFSARFMIIAMMLTPLVMLFPKARALRWLMRRRRYLGVAAFFYAALHTLAYVLHEGTLQRMLAEFPELGIWTGWVASLVLIPLAATSNEYSVRTLGAMWKRVQRFAYVAAVATLVHWMFVSKGLDAALVHFVPLAILETYRIGRNLKFWSFKFA